MPDFDQFKITTNHYYTYNYDTFLFVRDISSLFRGEGPSFLQLYLLKMNDDSDLSWLEPKLSEAELVNRKNLPVIDHQYLQKSNVHLRTNTEDSLS